MSTRISVKAHREPMWQDRIEVFYITSSCDDLNGSRCHVGQLTLVEVKEDDAFLKPEPTFSLPMDAAQKLMDDLWYAGLRPTEGTGSAGALSAVQKHLEDMRTLVFKDVKKP